MHQPDHVTSIIAIKMCKDIQKIIVTENPFDLLIFEKICKL